MQPYQSSGLKCSKAHAPNLLCTCDIVYPQLLNPL